VLDNLLAEYGPEARPIREQMRSIIGPLADRLLSLFPGFRLSMTKLLRD
jgi:hypothetical protein